MGRASTKGGCGGRSNVVGKGKVTPFQVAFIVDHYLAENNFSQTRSAFRSEAASLLPKPIEQAPNSLLSLGLMLDEYIRLKEQTLILDQERSRVEQEKLRVHTLLQGMQDVMNVYNSGNAPTPPSLTTPPLPSAPVVTPSAGHPAYMNPAMTSVAMTQSVKLDHTNFSTPITSSRPPRKRKNYKDSLEAPKAPKKIYCSIPNNQLLNKGGNSTVALINASNGTLIRQQSPCPETSVPKYTKEGSPVQGSSVAKNLFNKRSLSPTSNSSGPKTPPREPSSQSDKSISPLEEISSTAKSHNNETSLETTPTCTIISSKTIIMSPTKQFSIERNHCTFSSPSKTNLKKQNTRDHVKGRLDFDGSDNCLESAAPSSGDGSSTSESEKEGDMFDFDIPNFDNAFGPDFSLTELLTDFGIDCENFDHTCPTTSAPKALSETNNREDLVQHTSSMTEGFAGNTNQNGTFACVDSMTSVKSVTKCIRLVSPSKSSRNISAHDIQNTSGES